jgi:hypothetical protein
MPLKLNVGIQKKHGLPNYSSIGAGCHIELELDQALLWDDPEGFHDRVRRTYAACREAVEAELARQMAGDAAVAAEGFVTNGHSPDKSSAPGEHHTVDDRPASRRQLDYIVKLAGQIHDFEDRQLVALANHLFGNSPAEFSSLQASQLIVVLQDLKAGRIDLDSARDRAA